MPCRSKPWFLFESKDMNGDPFTDDYNDFCDEKYASECRNYCYKKLVLTRSALLKLAEAYKTKREAEYPDEYNDYLPSLCKHLHQMINSGKYVFSTDFLTRGYRLDRTAAEKMWRITCMPELAEQTDIALAVFTNNPELGDAVEEDDIWQPPPQKVYPRFDSVIDLPRDNRQNISPIISPRMGPNPVPHPIPQHSTNISTPLSRHGTSEPPLSRETPRPVPDRLKNLQDRITALGDSRDFKSRSRLQYSEFGSESSGSDF